MSGTLTGQVQVSWGISLAPTMGSFASSFRLRTRLCRTSSIPRRSSRDKRPTLSSIQPAASTSGSTASWQSACRPGGTLW